MNIQEKIIQNAGELRGRVAALAGLATKTAQAGASLASRRWGGMKEPLKVVASAGQDFTRMARQHLVRFLDENRVIAADAGKDFGALARRTLSTLRAPGTKAVPLRKKKTARTRRAAKSS